MKQRPDHSARAGRLLMGVAATISLYMAAMALSHTSLPGCGPGSDCQQALHSRWAYSFGIPVSFAGFVLYSVTLLLSWAFVRRERTFSGLQGGMAVAAVMAGAAWFSGVQIFALQSLCIWCCLTQVSAVAGAALLWTSRSRHPLPDLDCSSDLRDAGSPLSNDRVFRFGSIGAALIGGGLLATGTLSGPQRATPATAHAQTEPVLTISPPPSSTAAPAATGTPGLRIGGQNLNPADYPAIGATAEGARTAVLLSDFTSLGCLKYHATLENVTTAGAKDVRILVLPAAQSPEATAIQRTMLAVFHADPGAWRSLAALITSGQIKAKPAEVERAARNLVREDKLTASAEANAGKIQAQLDLTAAFLSGNNGEGASPKVLPQLRIEDRVLPGADHDPVKITAFLSESRLSDSRPAGQPVMAIVNSEMELRDLQPGRPQDFQIQVENRGDAPLQIGWLVLDEGCEVIAMPQRIPPGKPASIGMRLRPPATGGDFTRSLHIHSNSPGSPARVNVKASCVESVANASPALSSP